MAVELVVVVVERILDLVIEVNEVEQLVWMVRTVFPVGVVLIEDPVGEGEFEVVDVDGSRVVEEDELGHLLGVDKQGQESQVVEGEDKRIVEGSGILLQLD